MKRMTTWAPAALPTCLLASTYPWRNKTYIVMNNAAHFVASDSSSMCDCPTYCSSSRRHAPQMSTSKISVTGYHQSSRIRTDKSVKAQTLQILSIGNRSVTHRDLCLR